MNIQLTSPMALLLAFCAVFVACEPAAEPDKSSADAPAKPAAQPVKEVPKEPATPPAPAIKAEVRGKDQREMVFVSAGPFVRGSKDDVGTEEERPQKTLNIDAFWIDRTEISVADWRKCVEAGPCRNTQKLYREYKAKKKKRPEQCNYGQEGRENHPMNCVSWHGARIYCKWAGKRMPTEAEWEKAARGTDGRLYPWGNQKADCSRACMIKQSLYGCGQRTSCPVKSKGKRGMSPYGAYDMAGSVYEWVADTYTRDFYMNAPQDNPVNKARTAQRPVRGGAYSSDDDGVRTAKRSSFEAKARTRFVGFRCAMNP